ncbi:MAG: carboxypeptidase-like regulatory domain-containing protein, partial [Planctomycetota bacterium]
LVLRVHDLAARTPVPTFRWQFRNANGTWRGTGENGHANLGLPPANVGQLLVEAEGLAPFARDGVVAATPPQEPQPLDVFLGPLVPAAGITLHVRDLGLRPVANVRVDAFALADDAPATGWQTGPSVWARRNADANGRYVLPALQPGRYGIRVVATDGEGALLPLLPFHRVFVLSGDNGFVEDVALEPGALLALELFDATGQPYDPARAGTATLHLQQLGGPPLARKWVVQQQGAAAAAIEVLPGVGKVMLAEAVPHGQYTFEVLVNGTLRVTRPLFLRPGLTHAERVDVP